MASKTISFRIFQNDQLVDTRAFTQEVIKLGRLGSSHLRLDDDAVGRMHAVIEVGQSGDVRLVDLGSNTGTRINGATIEGSHALRSGDRLELGPYALEIAIADPTPARPDPVRAQNPQSMATATPSPQQPAIDLSKIEDASEQVAEVVTTYGRSILDVAHVGQSRSRKRSAIPLLALGGVFMAGGLGLFGFEVAQPWEQYNKDVAEAAKHHREAPEAPGLGTGSLGMLLALLGLVPFVAGGLRMRDESIDAFTIGEGSEASFKVNGEALPNPAATPLVSRVSGGYALSFAPEHQGSVEIGEQRVSLQDLVSSGRARQDGGAYVYALPKGARAKVEHGEVAFNVNLVNRGAVVAGRGEVDWPFWGYFGGTATLATAFYMLMRSMPDDALALQLEDEAAAERFAAYFHQADEVDEPEPEETEIVQPDEKSAGGETGKRAGGPEGAMGKPESKATGKAYAMSGPQNGTPQLARTFDPNMAAERAGILGILAQQEGHFLASPDGGAFAVGTDDQDVWGQMVGTEVGESYGVGGLGLVGSGRRGGGADGLIGLGSTGLIGHGNGTGGTGFGPDGGGSGVVGFNKKKKKVPVTRVGKADIDGSIDKDLIRRVVRSHLMEVRGCYNAGLSRNPNLEGRVLVQFSIVGTGKVGMSVVQENTTKDKSVGNCIAKAVKRWRFPKPSGGSTALVTYPFRLSSR